MDLESIYLETLARCTPERLIRTVVRNDMPRHVVAIGKCAGALLDGIAAVHELGDGFAAVPAGYRMPAPRPGLDVAIGGHPDYTADSFAAGRRLLDFVDAHDDILFLISGGGSACVEVPRPPFPERDLVAVNAQLVASGIPIGEINIVRKHLSAIKGGRLGARVRGRSVTLVYSDVSTGRLQDVASAPTIADRTTSADAAAILERVGGHERIVTILRSENAGVSVPPAHDSAVYLIAENATLTGTAASILRERGFATSIWDGQIETDVEPAAAALVDRASQMRAGEILVAGGEPTVVKRGSGRGGRCSELAVRFVRRAQTAGVHNVAALFGSSDGLDGNSGVAGIAIDGIPLVLDASAIEEDLRQSNSFATAVRLGRAIMIPPAGNNLRDLFLLARS